MKTSLKWVLAIVIATTFVVVQTVGAEETTPADDIEIADFGSNAAIDRDSLTKSLATRWVDQSGESVEVLEQIFSSSTTEQLMVADEATSYEQVRDVLDSFGPSADYVYTPVNPCVIFDTRFGGGGVLSPGFPRQFHYGSGHATRPNLWMRQ